MDGFAREHVVMPATPFTLEPNVYDAVKTARIATAGLTAWGTLHTESKVK